MNLHTHSDTANRLVERINNLRRFAHKSDLLRYCLLYKLGGVYIDIDLKPLVPFRDIIKDYNFYTNQKYSQNIL